MVVLEGPDGGGKTTLFEKLREKLPGHEFLHSGGPIKGREDLIARMSASRRQQVRDRHFCISEPIYGPFFGRPNTIFGPVMQHFLRFNPLVVFCFSPTGELPTQEGVHDTPEHAAGVAKNHRQIVEQYRILAGRHLPYKSTVYTWHNWEEIIKQIVAHESFGTRNAPR